MLVSLQNNLMMIPSQPLTVTFKWLEQDSHVTKHINITFSNNYLSVLNRRSHESQVTSRAYNYFLFPSVYFSIFCKALHNGYLLSLEMIHDLDSPHPHTLPTKGKTLEAEQRQILAKKAYRVVSFDCQSQHGGKKPDSFILGNSNSDKYTFLQGQKNCQVLAKMEV